MHRLLRACARVAPLAACIPLVEAVKERRGEKGSILAGAGVHIRTNSTLPSSSWLTSLSDSLLGSTVHCDSFHAEADSFDSDLTTASGTVVPDEVPPEDFDDVEHSKSFVVNDVNGVNIMLMTALTGVMERERASVGTQIMIDKGYHTMYIYSDDRNPLECPLVALCHIDLNVDFVVQSISAVYQPGPEGHILRLALNRRFGASTTFELEGQFDPKTVYALKAGTKVRAHDFNSALALKSGQQGTQAEFSYHQRVRPNLTAGGSLLADLKQVTPVPSIGGLSAAVFGTYQQGKNTWLVRFNASNATGTLRLYREAEKHVELGAYYTLNAETLDTSAGIGCKLGLGKEAAGPGMPSSVLTFNASNDLKVGVSLSNTMFSNFSSTQLLTILSASFDHKNQDHSIGAQFQFHY